MINKRLVSLLANSKKYVAGNVFFQWINLLANIWAIFAIGRFIEAGYYGHLDKKTAITTIIILLIAVIARLVCNLASTKMSYLSSKYVKKTLRGKIFDKMLKFGAGYSNKVATSEVVQISVEGVEQLESYFGAYLPQLFYALLAPLTLFAVIGSMSITAAIVLIVCIPIIPLSIAAVQTFAKKLLAKYWGKYTGLGDTFLENLQGLTTLKIYQADEYKNEKMNQDAEEFRKITMKVLTMQLNSITIMDIVAYGGAALGIFIAVRQFLAGNLEIGQVVTIILLSADFFIPMRQLGSFFHIAMNGMAASEKIFKIIDTEDLIDAEKEFPDDSSISIEKLQFSYDGEKEILKDITFQIPKQGMISIVGESGSGKSTIGSILMKRQHGYSGNIFLYNENMEKDRIELRDICENSVMKNITYISHNSYIFKGTVRSNLLMAKADANEEEMWQALEEAKLKDFFSKEAGLDTELSEGGNNLSGGQKQRLALARGILHNSRLYIFDEATSNIDVESEEAILERIGNIAKTKAVLFISHRLANVVNSKKIYVIENGEISESGTHEQLLEKRTIYRRLWDGQLKLENIRKEGAK